MEQKTGSRRILRKVWYGAAITLSVLLLVICSVGVVGTWIVKQRWKALNLPAATE